MPARRNTATVPDSLGDVRADKVVAVVFSLPRSVARRLIDQGAVLVDDAPVAPAQRLRAGAALAVDLPDDGRGLQRAAVPFAVVREDPEVLIVDKPAGLVVHPGAGTTGPTLVAGLVHRFPELEAMADHRWGLVHRLDRDTSGLLIVARAPDAFDRLQHALRRREIDRRYLCLVTGRTDGATGTVDAPIGRDPRNPVRMAVVPGGRPARTHYTRLAEWQDASLLEVRLETGRTHQIRVHMASIGRHVVGDPTYGSRHPVTTELERQWLHAAALGFDHPAGRGRVEAASVPPPELRAAVAGLGPPIGGQVPRWHAEDVEGVTGGRRTRRPTSKP